MKVLLPAIAVVCLFAAPAAAQLRDPFAPAIAPPGATTTTTTATTTGGEAPLQPAPTTDALADTGADVQGWVVVAFGIFSVGAGALYLFKLYERPLT